MALANPFNVMPLNQVSGNRPEPVDIELPDGMPPSKEDGALKTELPDGSVVIDINPILNRRVNSEKFDANLAEDMDDNELNRIASDLLAGIELDNQSRQEWLDTHAEGIKLLGLIIEDARGDAGASSAPLEGMSTVRHPLLLEAVLMFQATARGELLPAAGPVKIRDDKPEKPPQPPQISPMVAPQGPAPMPPDAGPSLGQPPHSPFPPPPANPMMGHNSGPPMQPPLAGGAAMPLPPDDEGRDEMANAFEKDFNHYLTTTAKEYYPDTVQMLFGVGFGGEGVKKVYNCPIRRRPVSESVPIEDFIVSNALTSLGNAGRITHQTKMRPSTLRRMQLAGVYRDILLGIPTQSDQPTSVDQAKAAVVGVQPQQQDPRDADYTVLECYCELTLDQYAPRKFKNKSLPLPYRVTLEKDSRKVLEIRRNWLESDEQCIAREFFVEYPFVKAFGFYGIGLLHILGNTTKTLTAAWREFIDSGMFSNFPGFLYAKGAGRQLTNQFRVAPGSGVGLDIGLQDIKSAVMPLPYKDLGPAFSAFIQHVEEIGTRLGGTAQTNIAEGRADAPVGTTLALIEQAMKPTGAVLKNMHTAQAKEFQLFKERFREDPESFWRSNPRPAMKWQKEQFLKALEDYDIVPVSDPNNPTMLHRAMKGEWIAQKAALAPMVIDPRKAFIRAAQLSEIDDAEDLLLPPAPPQAPPVDPAKMAEVQVKAQVAAQQAQTKTADAQLRAQSQQQKIQADAQKTKLDMEIEALRYHDNEAERASRERLAMMDQRQEQLRLASTLAIHSDSTAQAREALHTNIISEHIGHDKKHAHEIQRETIKSRAKAAPKVKVP